MTHLPHSKHNHSEFLLLANGPYVQVVRLETSKSRDSFLWLCHTWLIAIWSLPILSTYHSLKKAHAIWLASSAKALWFLTTCPGTTAGSWNPPSSKTLMTFFVVLFYPFFQSSKAFSTRSPFLLLFEYLVPSLCPVETEWMTRTWKGPVRQCAGPMGVPTAHSAVSGWTGSEKQQCRPCEAESSGTAWSRRGEWAGSRVTHMKSVCYCKPPANPRWVSILNKLMSALWPLRAHFPCLALWTAHPSLGGGADSGVGQTCQPERQLQFFLLASPLNAPCGGRERPWWSEGQHLRPQSSSQETTGTPQRPALYPREETVALPRVCPKPGFWGHAL